MDIDVSSRRSESRCMCPGPALLYRVPVCQLFGVCFLPFLIVFVPLENERKGFVDDVVLVCFQEVSIVLQFGKCVIVESNSDVFRCGLFGFGN